MTSKEFSPWFDLEQLDRTALVSAAFVYQIKDASQLLIYPSGRSAMLFYGETTTGSALDETLRSIKNRFPAGQLRFRYRPDPHSIQSLGALLRRFEKRFGALPLGNQPLAD